MAWISATRLLAMMALSRRPVSNSSTVGGVLAALKPGGESAVYLQGVHLDGIRFLFAGDNVEILNQEGFRNFGSHGDISIADWSGIHKVYKTKVDVNHLRPSCI
jgi:hypothetical protein